MYVAFLLLLVIIKAEQDEGKCVAGEQCQALPHNDLETTRNDGGGSGGGGGFRTLAEMYHWALNATNLKAGDDKVAKDVKVVKGGSRKLEVDQLPDFEGEAEQLRRALDELRRMRKDDGRGDEKSVVEVLEFVGELCHGGDNGIEMMKMGGLDLLGEFVEEGGSMDLSAEALRAMSVCVRNNEKVGKYVLDKGIVGLVLGVRRVEELRGKILGVVGGVFGVVGGEGVRGMAEEVGELVGLGLDGDVGSVEGRRSIVRALNLIGDLLRVDGKDSFWKNLFEKNEVQSKVDKFLTSDNVDVKDSVEAFNSAWKQ